MSADNVTDLASQRRERVRRVLDEHADTVWNSWTYVSQEPGASFHDLATHIQNHMYFAGMGADELAEALTAWWPGPQYVAATPTGGATPVLAVDRLAPARIDWSGEFWTHDADADDFLIAPLIPRGRATALYAGAKSKKSLITLTVAAAAATGRPVLDHPGGEPVRILYLDMEMTPADVRERLVDMGFGPGDDLEPLAYYSLPALGVLDSVSGGADLLELAQAHRADLVVIDTMSRVLGGEEDKADTLRAFARHTGQVLKAAGIAYLRIDHAGKDVERGQRGSSAKVDDVDVVWQLIARDRGRYDLKATHKRMAWVQEVVHLQEHDDPLGYSIVNDSWAAGTAEVADLLDRLGVPIDHGKTRARQALKAAGESAGNDALMSAIRYRRAEQARQIAATDGAP